MASGIQPKLLQKKITSISSLDLDVQVNSRQGNKIAYSELHPVWSSWAWNRQAVHEKSLCWFSDRRSQQLKMAVRQYLLTVSSMLSNWSHSFHSQESNLNDNVKKPVPRMHLLRELRHWMNYVSVWSGIQKHHPRCISRRGCAGWHIRWPCHAGQDGLILWDPIKSVAIVV